MHRHPACKQSPKLVVPMDIPSFGVEKFGLSMLQSGEAELEIFMQTAARVHDLSAAEGVPAVSEPGVETFVVEEV